MKNYFLPVLMSLLLLLSCRHDAQKELKGPAVLKSKYDFATSSGPFYTGDTVVFTSSALASDHSHWYFGNYVYHWKTRYEDGYINYACDTCEEHRPASAYDSKIDSISGSSVSHVFYSPGTYNIVLTVNGDIAYKKIRPMTFISCMLFDTGLTKMRHWTYNYHYYGTAVDSIGAYVTDFAIAKLSDGRVNLPFDNTLSNSSQLVYGRTYYNADNQRVEDHITYFRLADSVSWVGSNTIDSSTSKYSHCSYSYTSGPAK